MPKPPITGRDHIANMVGDALAHLQDENAALRQQVGVLEAEKAELAKQVVPGFEPLDLAPDFTGDSAIPPRSI